MLTGQQSGKKSIEEALPPTGLIKTSPGKEWMLSPPQSVTKATPLDVQPAVNAPNSSQTRVPGRKKGRWIRRVLSMLSFLLCVVCPTTIVGYYYFIIASPQYMVEIQFAVRGSNSESLSFLGISALPGATGQSSDSYIVQNYIRSQQLVKDVLRDQGYDIRTPYSRPFIDIIYKIPKDLPFIDFEGYWQNRNKVEYNTISGNTTVRTFAFTPQDAKDIAQAIIQQSESLVNNLSSESRLQLIGTAEQEVQRTEERLRRARIEMQRFQNETQIVNPASIGQLEYDLVGKLEAELTDLVTRRRAISGSISQESPVLRTIDRQIEAIKEQLILQRKRIGSGNIDENTQGSLVDVTTVFVELSTTQEFANEAYIAALASLEAAKAVARQQDRYLATYIPPELPDASRYPKPFLYTGIAALWALFGWLVLTFLVRTIRDHVA